MDPSSEILTHIRRIVRSINLESKRIQKDFGISIPQLLCLEYLSKCEDFQSTHGNITKHLYLNSSTVTGIINRLEKKGYIARMPKKGDKRLTYISLTSSGYKVLQGTPDLLHEKLKTNLSKLQPQKIQNIKTSLNYIITAIGIEEVDASPVLTIDDPIQPMDY